MTPKTSSCQGFAIFFNNISFFIATSLYSLFEIFDLSNSYGVTSSSAIFFA